jgi:hypothetical protein
MKPRFAGLFAVACTYAIAALADDPPKAPPPCATPAHRQFDFWIGDWDVRNPAGKLVGRNQITVMHNGCVLLESWSGNGGVTGSSFNLYDAERGKWHQTWVDNSGSLLVLEGGLAGSRMVLASAPGEAMSRITWEPLADGRVRQLWESSADRGATWKTAFDGYYEKRK